jgi:arylsulfatase A-like enzyme
MLDKPRLYQRLRRQLWDQVSQQEAEEGLRHYWAMCTLQDWFVRDLLAELERTGQAENTAVVFVSDHGDYAYAHGLAVMGIAAFREAYHVPLVVRWPAGVTRPGRTIDEWVTLADLAPTLLELAGVQTSYPFSGRSLVPFLRDEATPLDWPDAWFSQTKGNECYYTQRIVATKEWKYVCNWFDFDELYDLRRDPHELVNLAFPSPEALTRGSGDPPVARREEFQPWPPLAPELDAVRRELLGRMWRFALREHDIIFNAHPPVALPPYGPLVGLRGERPSASSAEVPEPRPPLPR